MGEQKEDTERARLGRLPAGKHGLSREFVSRNQSERLAAGVIAAVAERGFQDAGVTAISAAAGVSRRTFYSYFKDKEECYLATYDLFEEHLLAVLAAQEGPRGWPGLVRRRVASLLEFLSGNPDLVRFSLVAPPAAGGAVDERARTFLERLVAGLTDGHPGEASAVEQGAMAGAISAVIVGRVEQETKGSLEAAAPELIELLLTPYVGRRRAIAESEKRSGSA